jgi:hypothetical protein
MPRFAARLTAEIRLLADRLRAVPHGGTVSYQELSNLAGHDVRRYRYRLERARDLLLEENSIAFDTVRKTGLRRFVVEDLPNVGAATRKHCRRSARRGRHVMTKAGASFNDIPTLIQRRLMAEDGMLHLLEIFGADRVVRKLEGRDKPLPVAIVARTLLQLLAA